MVSHRSSRSATCAIGATGFRRRSGTSADERIGQHDLAELFGRQTASCEPLGQRAGRRPAEQSDPLTQASQQAVAAVHGVGHPAVALPALTSTADGAIRTGAASAAQAEAWLDDQRRLADQDRLLVAIPLFLAAGRRP
jgi:hypothetical protein